MTFMMTYCYPAGQFQARLAIPVWAVILWRCSHARA